MIVPCVYIKPDNAVCPPRDSNTLFRGNSLATKAIDEFMKHAGMHYLHDTIKCLVDEVSWKPGSIQLVRQK